jgi:hypothetical protein
MRFIWILLAFTLTFFICQDVAGAQTDEERDGLYDAMGYAMVGGSIGDLLSTQYALSNGARELNPLQQNTGVRVASAVAFPVVAIYLSDELRKDGHPKLALWFRIALVALKGYAIAHNLRTVR